MLVINSIEKTRLSADSYSYSGTGVAWKARLVLFLGFALMAGGLAGSVVSRRSSLGGGGGREGGCGSLMGIGRGFREETELGKVDESGLTMCCRLFWC